MPFEFAKMGEGGKKDAKQAAAEKAGVGRIQASPEASESAISGRCRS
jgi:hypothetical protein